MIEFSRTLARQFRAVLRRSLMEAEPRGPWPVVVCRADRRGLSLEALQGDLAVRHRQEGVYPPEVINFPGGLLAEMEGRSDVPVALEAVEGGKGRAHWSEGAVPRAVEFDMAAPDTLADVAGDAEGCTRSVGRHPGGAGRGGTVHRQRSGPVCRQLRPAAGSRRTGRGHGWPAVARPGWLHLPVGRERAGSAAADPRSSGPALGGAGAHWAAARTWSCWKPDRGPSCCGSTRTNAFRRSSRSFPPCRP